MSLNYNLSKIKNYKDVCYVADDDGGGNHLSPVTESIILATMGAGIGTITAKNAPEFWARTTYWNRLVASTGLPSSVGFTFADVQAHVGLHTNVSNETRTQWLNILKKYIDRELTALKYKAEKELNND